jgi:hypothetical protein
MIGHTVAYLPHAGAVETDEPQNMHTTVVSSVFSVMSQALLCHAELCLTSSPLAMLCLPHFALHCALLGNAVNSGSCNSIECCVLPHVRFRIYRRD